MRKIKQKQGVNYFYRHKRKFLVLFVFFVLWWTCLPNTIFKTPYSTIVQASNGQLLGGRIADDGQWRFPELDSVPYRFKECILYFEDEYFYYHPGVNPVSTLEALWVNMTTDRRIGGSTITQQVMRLAHNNPKRTYWEKFIETMQALRLEVTYSKNEILKMYASHAPFGGNTIGLAAASWRYFGVSPNLLSWGQAATLAVLPNAPSLVYPGKNQKILKKKRDGLLKKLYKNKVIDKTTYKLAIAETLPGSPLPLPNIAPHFTAKMEKEHKGERVHSFINFKLQKAVNNIVSQHYNQLKDKQIYNMAVLVLDVHTRQVLAYVGNTPTTVAHDKYVDIVDRPRSTGSILKPFLYAALFDDGIILPKTLVPDIPTNIDGYVPKDFDKKYRGAVPVSQALTKSLNIPAVRLLQRYGLTRFYHILQKVKQSQINKPPNYYGLSIILGGAESTLWDVTNAFAGMASTLEHYHQTSDKYYTNEYASPLCLADTSISFQNPQFDAPVFGAGAIYNTLNIMRNLNRPRGDKNWKLFSSSQPIAWKTGTSHGFRDAWSVGVTKDYAIGVWVGNAEGGGRPGLIGVEAAAPVLFDVLSKLPSSSWFSPPYDDLIQVNVCKKSGYLAGKNCEDTIKEWVARTGRRTKTCPYHRTIFLNQNGQFRVNASCYPRSKMVEKKWFHLPPIEAFYYRRNHPNYRDIPPFLSSCSQLSQKRMAFVFPQPNQTILLPKNFDTGKNEVVLKVAHSGENNTLYWYLGTHFLGKTTTFNEISIHPKPGKYKLTVVDQTGYTISTFIQFKKAS